MCWARGDKEPVTAAPSAPERAVGPSTALSVARARMGGTDGMLWGPEERAAVPPELGRLDFPLGDLGQSPVPLTLRFFICKTGIFTSHRRF